MFLALIKIEQKSAFFVLFSVGTFTLNSVQFYQIMKHITEKLINLYCLTIMFLVIIMVCVGGCVVLRFPISERPTTVSYCNLSTSNVNKVSPRNAIKNVTLVHRIR